jgi:hypothetical protein
MANFDGTQEFMAAHKDHKTSISMIELSDCRYVTEIIEYKLPWEGPEDTPHLSVALGEKDSEEWLQNTGAYLFCHTCEVEEEINLGEVVED